MIPEGLQSQVAQDLFAFELCGKNGTFLEIGCSAPKHRSNTWWLEQTHGWRGVMMDNDANACRECRAERHPDTLVIEQDCTQFDFSTLKAKHYDYLSLDVDWPTPEALLKILRGGITFRCATVEHDAWRFGPFARSVMRGMLESQGYRCVYPEVTCRKEPFEFWWVDSSFGILPELTGPFDRE